MKIRVYNGNTLEPELDQVVYAGVTPVVLSFYDRTQQCVNSFSAGFLRENNRKKAGSCIDVRAGWRRVTCPAGSWKARYARRDAGKEILYHGMITNEVIGERIFMFETEEDLHRITYNYLMEHFDIRVLPEWCGAIMKELQELRPPQCAEVRNFSWLVGEYTGEQDKIFRGKRYVEFPELLTEAAVEGIVTKLLKGGAVRIPGADRNQLPMGIHDLDTYLKEQGTSLAANLQELLSSHVGLQDEVKNVAFKDFSLYQQQGLMANGAVSMLTGKKRAGKSRYCFLAMDMGTGKTATAVSIVEKYANDKFLRTHPGTDFKEVLEDESLVRYRVMILAPGHLLEKWKREVEDRVPYATCVIIKDFSQLTALRERPEPSGREFFVISKDFAKLDYMEQPVPSRMKYSGMIFRKFCSECGKEYRQPGDICPFCGGRGYRTDPELTLGTASGLQCPECGNVLLPYKTYQPEEGCQTGLMPGDFARPTTHNQKCYWCGMNLWQPYVRNISAECWFGEEEEKPKEPAWKRITVVKNAGTGKTETRWAHKRFDKKLIETAVSERRDNDGCRKAAPGGYIKKYLRFDFLIADEAHEYKGTSAQGEVFSALCAVSKRVLALTGTITGGKACDLFYLLYRLDPARMVADGFRYGDAVQFSYRYGKVVRELRYDEDGIKNIGTSSRNVRYGSPRVEPGISPLVYPKFLHDRQVALNLSDMSANLPKLSEKVITVTPDEEEEEIMNDYLAVIDTLKRKSREPGMYGLLSSMLQFSLSYLDRPYTEERRFVFDPYGEPVCLIPQHDFMRDPARLSSKEKALVEDVREQLLRGRNCVVYCEYTNSPDTNITDRLKTVLGRETGVRVEILKASSPQPSEREAYMRKLTEEGTRVWITNPRCTETGLDFIWTKDGVTYNFPTIINFQLGYSLPVVMQSTRRHYRLIQTEECETHYICWDGTIETAVLKVIAEKQMAHSSVQGKFSAEGLAAMVNGTDARKEIFSALMKNDRTSGADLQGMFDVIAERRKSANDSGEKKMPTVRDILGDGLYEEKFGAECSGIYSLSGLLGEEGDAEMAFDGFEIF